MTKSIEDAIKDGTIEDKISKLEAHKRAIEEKIKECQEAWEKSKKPKLAIPFVPEEGEKYCLYINGHYCTTTNGENEYDFAHIKEGNAFRTKEEAELAYEKLCAEAELLRMCDGLDIMDEGVKVFGPRFDRDDKCWYPDYWDTFLFYPYRFASQESCQDAINKLGDRKLRLILNIPVED